ncbi:MAG: DUF2004 domain-containing protein [Rhodocyclaceae bacterium]|nr:DUF2004 domain-containing protein [Rhodocyclaceae bacterium]
MTQFSLPVVGTLDFPADTDGYWEFSLELAGRTVRFDVNVEGGEMTKSLLDTVKSFVIDAVRFDSSARSAIRTDFADDSEGSSSLYLIHHVDELSDEEREKYFGSKDAESLGVDQLLKALYLKRIGLYPDSDDYAAVFDYTVDEDATDYILAVEFDESGEVFGISMDS